MIKTSENTSGEWKVILETEDYLQAMGSLRSFCVRQPEANEYKKIKIEQDGEVLFETEIWIMRT